MVAYIRKMKDWSVIKWAEPFEWSVPIWSNDNAKGSFKFAPNAPIDKAQIGEWLQFGENLWVIKDIKPNETEIVISVQDAFNAFYRSHIVPTGYTETGEFLEAVLNINYKAQGDTEYAMPYLNVSNSDATPLIFPTLKSDILFVMSDYMREVSKRGVKISFTPTYSGIDIEITTQGTSHKAIPMDDGHSQHVKTEFSSSITSKVTVVVEGVNKYWYLQADGTAAMGIAPSPRIPGKWETIVVDDEAKSQDEVEKIFAKNTASSQIEFYSDKTFEFNEPVLILHGKKQYKAQISYVEINSDDNRCHYKAGDMPTTLIEKLRPVINNNEAAETKSSGSGGGGSTPNAVLYTPQLLTEAQKEQARNNIGAGTGSGGETFDINALTQTSSLANSDTFPFYDASAAGPRKTTWSNVKAKLKTYFDTLYIGAASLVGYATEAWVTAKGYGTYTMPANGIPKYHLASAVQTSLGKADTAVQRFDVTFSQINGTWSADKTWDEVATAALTKQIVGKVNGLALEFDYHGQNNSAHLFYSAIGSTIYEINYEYSGAIHYTFTNLTTTSWVQSQGYATEAWVTAKGYGTYTMPANGIPKYHLASAVQTSLGKADTAVQRFEVTFSQINGTWSADKTWDEVATAALTNQIVGKVNGLALEFDYHGQINSAHLFYSAIGSTIYEINYEYSGAIHYTFTNLATTSWVQSQGYATEAWVTAKGYGTYSLPSGGIPENQLASAVQAKLNSSTGLDFITYDKTDNPSGGRTRRCRQWNSGLQEHWYSIPLNNVAFNSGFGTMYISAFEGNHTYMKTFVGGDAGGNPISEISWQPASGSNPAFTWMVDPTDVTGSTSSGPGTVLSMTPKFGLVRPDNTPVSGIATIYTRGRWK